MNRTVSGYSASGQAFLNTGLLALILAGLLSAWAIRGETAQKGIFEPPSLRGFSPKNSYLQDGDGDGIKETRVDRFTSPSGHSLFSLTTKDRTWAWSLETPGADDSDLGANYVIWDSDCDGVFDRRYRLDEEFRIPPCLN